MSEEKKKFEDELKRLDEIVNQISSKSLPLDESLKLYEEGTKIISRLNQKLKDAEAKAEKVVNIEEK